MRVLVTGGAGYVGSRVTAHLLAQGADVTVFDNLTFGGQGLLPFVGSRSFRFVRGDICDTAAMARIMPGHDAVVHLAAIVGEDACGIDPQLTEKVNRDAAIAVLDVAERAGATRFLFFSTCSNYGLSDAGVLADEDSELRPLSLYARTKVAVERHILEKPNSISATVLRLGTICGLSARMRFDLLIGDMGRAAATGKPIDIYKPDAWRPFLHVADAGRVTEHVLRADRNRVAGRVFNVVGDNYQKRALMELVHKYFPAAEIRVTDAQPDNRDYRVSGARIEHELNFLTRHTVEQAFVETATAVGDGVFVDPFWPGHSAVPIPATLPLANASIIR